MSAQFKTRNAWQSLAYILLGAAVSPPSKTTVQSIVMSMSICLGFFCSLAYLRNYTKEVQMFCALWSVAVARSSDVIVIRICLLLYIRFIHDVIFSHNQLHNALCIFLNSDSVTAETTDCISCNYQIFTQRQRIVYVSSLGVRNAHRGRSVRSTIALLILVFKYIKSIHEKHRGELQKPHPYKQYGVKRGKKTGLCSSTETRCGIQFITNTRQYKFRHRLTMRAKSYSDNVTAVIVLSILSTGSDIIDVGYRE